MENDIVAEIDGIVLDISVAKGFQVNTGDLLFTIESI